MLGIPIKVMNNVIFYNEEVTKNVTIPDSVLTKKHKSLEYQLNERICGCWDHICSTDE